MSTSSMSSSHPTFSALDEIAASSADIWLLIGRLALAWVFVVFGAGHVFQSGRPGRIPDQPESAGSRTPVMDCLDCMEVIIGITLGVRRRDPLRRRGRHCFSDFVDGAGPSLLGIHRPGGGDSAGQLLQEHLNARRYAVCLCLRPRSLQRRCDDEKDLTAEVGLSERTREFQ